MPLRRVAGFPRRGLLRAAAPNVSNPPFPADYRVIAVMSARLVGFRCTVSPCLAYCGSRLLWPVKERGL